MKVLRQLAAIVCLAGSVRGAAPDNNGDAQREIETTLRQYAEVKTDMQRAAVAQYLQQLDRTAVAAALVAQIEQARNGPQATLYNGLIGSLQPEACAEVLRQIGLAQTPDEKAKLLVALRHCPGANAQGVLAAALEDRRTFHFEARGKIPRRVCDLAYDELFLKLRADPTYGLDPSPRMSGIIRESTPISQRDALIRELAAKLAPASPAPAPPLTGGTSSATP